MTPSDDHQEIALSLLYYIEIGRNYGQVIEAKKYEINRQNNG